MICGKAQELLIKRRRARTPAKMAYYRRLLREHVKECGFCQRGYNKRVISNK